MSLSVGELVVALGMDTSNFVKGIGVAIEVGNRFADALSDVSKRAIMAASAFNETSNVIQQSFGTGAAAAEDWAKRTGDAMGRSTQQMREFVSVNQAAMSSMLGSAEAAAPLSKNLAQLAVDMGSFWNVNDKDAWEALRSAMTGIAKPMERYGIVMLEANLNAYLLSNGIHKTMENLDEASKVQVRYNFIMDKTNIVHGDAVRTSYSLANQLKIVQAEFDNNTTALGTGLLPLAKDTVSVFQEMMHVFTEGPGTGLQDFIIGVTSAMKALAETALVTAAAFGIFMRMKFGDSMDPFLKKIADLDKALNGEHVGAPRRKEIDRSSWGWSTPDADGNTHLITPQEKREQERKEALNNLTGTDKKAKLHLGRNDATDSQSFYAMQSITGGMGLGMMTSIQAANTEFGKNWLEKVLTPLQKEVLEQAEKEAKASAEWWKAQHAADDAILSDMGKASMARQAREMVPEDVAKARGMREYASAHPFNAVFGAQETVGQGAIQAVNAARGGDMSGAVLGVLKGMGETVSGAATGIISMASGAIQSVATAVIQNVIDGIKAVIGETKKVIEVFAPQDKRGAGALATGGAFVGAWLTAATLPVTLAMGPLGIGLLALVSIVGGAGTAFLNLLQQTKSYSQYQAALSKGVDRVVQALEPFFHQLLPVAGLFMMLSTVVGRFLSSLIPGPGVFHTIFNVVQGFAVILGVVMVMMLEFQVVITSVNATLWEWANELSKGKDPFISHMAGESGGAAERTRNNFDAAKEAVQQLNDTSYDAAGALANFKDTVAEATSAFNLPAWYRAGQTRWGASLGSNPAGSSPVSSGGGGPPPATIPDTAKGGFNTTEIVAVYVTQHADATWTAVKKHLDGQEYRANGGTPSLASDVPRFNG